MHSGVPEADLWPVAYPFSFRFAVSKMLVPGPRTDKVRESQFTDAPGMRIPRCKSTRTADSATLPPIAQKPMPAGAQPPPKSVARCSPRSN